MTTPVPESINDLILEAREEARVARGMTRPDPEGYGTICDLEADDDLLDRLADALTRLSAQVKSFGVVAPGSYAGAGEAPDDSEIDQIIAEAESFTEAIFDIADKYEVPVTNNSERWQDGQYLRHVGDFIEDIQQAAKKFKVGSSDEVAV